MMQRLIRLLFILGLGGAAPPAMSAPLPDPPPCKNCFIGTVVLGINPGDPSGRTKVLGDDLYFIDPDGLAWAASKGDITDGATIPALFQVVIGSAFENDFLPAAIIHDRYTAPGHRVRDWRATARMFYQAMVVRGVPATKAKTMYYAVYAFGPHWGQLQAGVPCGRNCVNTVPASGTVRAEAEAEYDAPSLRAEVAQIEQQVADAEARGEPLPLSTLEAEAKTRHPNNAFIAPRPLPGTAIE